MYRCTVLRVSPSSRASSLAPISCRVDVYDERIASPRSSDCDVADLYMRPGSALRTPLFYILEHCLDKRTHRVVRSVAFAWVEKRRSDGVADRVDRPRSGIR